MAKRTKAIPRCADCKTRKGKAHDGGTRPGRTDGSRFGFSGVLCRDCYNRHSSRARYVTKATRKAIADAERLAESEREFAAQAEAVQRCLEILSIRPRLANSCDLCGIPAPQRFDASDFEIEDASGKPGRICGGCREELRQERAVQRQAELAKRAYRSPKGESPGYMPKVYRLSEVNPHLISETRRYG